MRELAARWGSYTVAEGLETIGQLHSVREIGVAAGQGYLLSRPMSAPNLLRVDLNLIEAGGVVMSSSLPPLPPPPPVPHPHRLCSRANRLGSSHGLRLGVVPSAERPFKIGIQLPETEYEVRWSELKAMAQLAESAGFDSLWVGDHLLYRDEDGARGPWEAWSQLAALAAVTERMELGPLVAATSFHNPAMLAKKAATLDEISGGRLILGLGAGWNETEYSAYGFPYDHRVDRFAEAFTIIRTLLREGHIDFEGRYLPGA